MMKKLLVFLSCFVTLSACQTETAGVREESAAEAEMAQVGFLPPDKASDAQKAAAAANPSTPVVSPKQLIKQGSVTFETNNVEASAKDVLTHVSQYNGYVETESDSKTDGRLEKNMTLRIPAANFDRFLNALEKTADAFTFKEISVRDVTTEYIDLDTRLKNKKALEERYLALLKQANKIEDIVTIESKLAEVRTEIESTEGQFSYLKKEISYSTLRVTIFKETEQTSGFVKIVKRALYKGWDNLQLLFAFLISLWPLWIAVGLLYWFIKRRHKLP